MPKTSSLVLLALALAASASRAQVPSPVFSMGQPPLWQPYVAASSAAPTTTPFSAGTLLLGVRHPFLSPVEGLLTASGEVYGTFGHIPGKQLSTVGARVLAGPPVFGFALGPDWSWRNGIGLDVSYQTAIRRGGILGGGSMLRVDWRALGGGSHNVALGLTIPVGDRFAGRTRPRRTMAELPRGGGRVDLRAASRVSPAIDSALARVAQLADLIRASSSIVTPNDAALLTANLPAVGASGEPYVVEYAQSLARAFALAAGDDTAGARIAERARDGLLNDVLIPYDSLFGQPRPGIEPLTRTATSHFARWLSDSSGVPSAAQPAVLRVEERWLDAVQRARESQAREWRDSRFLWLPLQLALTPDQYEDQTQVDSLMARLVGRPFSDQNALAYLPSTQLELEIARSIFAARDYHVLWVHDFPAITPKRTLDTVSYHMVADVYLPALTAAVKRYDSTTVVPAPHFPVYMLVLDQYYYEPRNARLWMTILENPMGARIRLPGDHPDLEAHLRERQRELRDAVAASRSLQRDAASRGGADWIRRIVKVNVSITQPSDFSFRSARLLPPVPFTPDNVARDHRKIALYDLDEAHPYHGSMLIMGVGVGEEYASSTFEDHGYRLRGPAALEARAALRRLLARNGFRDEDIPAPLRAVKAAPSDTATERAMNHGDYVGRALQVHNEVGFGQKSASVTRALLYTLAPSGSIIIVPDGAWAAETWAAMLAGAAARGSRVFIITASIANSTNPDRRLVSVTREVMQQLLEESTRLAGLLHRTGGELRLGIFAAKAPANDPAGRAEEIREGLERSPWIKDLIPFNAQTLAVMERANTQSATNVSGGEVVPKSPTDTTSTRPELHQKTQLIARPGAIDALVRQPGWDQVIAQTMRVQSQLSARFGDQLGFTTPEVDTAATRQNDALLRGFERGISQADRKRVSFYFSLGSQNEDTRSLVLDGEATIIVSGFHAAAGLVDLYEIMARSTWITSPAELDPYLPRMPGFMGRLAHFIRVAL